MEKDRPESRGGSGGVEEPREVLDEYVLQNFTVSAVSDWKSVTRDTREGRQGRTRGASRGLTAQQISTINAEEESRGSSVLRTTESSSL